jgi:DNA helicase II / ATP-dependent DNA helicase PcrA
LLGRVPFVKFGGLKFLDASHIKDMLALLRFAEDPRDRVAGFRAMQLKLGAGPTSAQRALDHMINAADPIAALVDAPSPPRASGDDWRTFVATVVDLGGGGCGWPAELESARLWYDLTLIVMFSYRRSRLADQKLDDRQFHRAVLRRLWNSRLPDGRRPNCVQTEKWHLNRCNEETLP